MQDESGTLDEKELHICLLVLYDKLNDKLPCHVRIPTAQQVSILYERHQPSPGAALGEAEFLEVASDLFASDEHWWESVPVKIAVTVGLQLALFPLAGAPHLEPHLCRSRRTRTKRGVLTSRSSTDGSAPPTSATDPPKETWLNVFQRKSQSSSHWRKPSEALAKSDAHRCPARQLPHRELVTEIRQ